MNQSETYFKNYFSTINESLNSINTSYLEKIAFLIKKTSKLGRKVIIIG